MKGCVRMNPGIFKQKLPLCMPWNFDALWTWRRRETQFRLHVAYWVLEIHRGNTSTILWGPNSWVHKWDRPKESAWEEVWRGFAEWKAPKGLIRVLRHWCFCDHVLPQVWCLIFIESLNHMLPLPKTWNNWLYVYIYENEYEDKNTYRIRRQKHIHIIICCMSGKTIICVSVWECVFGYPAGHNQRCTCNTLQANIFSIACQVGNWGLSVALLVLLHHHLQLLEHILLFWNQWGNPCPNQPVAPETKSMLFFNYTSKHP